MSLGSVDGQTVKVDRVNAWAGGTRDDLPP